MKNTIKMMLMLVILLAGYTAQTNASGVSSIPGHVKNQIKQQAKQKWPKDYSMQKYTIKKQEAAYKKILKYRDSKVPTNIINNLKRQAVSRDGKTAAREHVSLVCKI
jgi:hypothetical protein